MAHYRLYFHGKSGHFLRAEDIDVESDDAACQKARELDHAHCIEVWQHARMIAKVHPESSTS